MKDDPLLSKQSSIQQLKATNENFVNVLRMKMNGKEWFPKDIRGCRKSYVKLIRGDPTLSVYENPLLANRISFHLCTLKNKSYELHPLTFSRGVSKNFSPGTIPINWVSDAMDRYFLMLVLSTARRRDW